MGLSLSNYFEALSSKIEYNAPIRQKRIKEITAILSDLPEIEELNKRFYDLSEEEEQGTKKEGRQLYKGNPKDKSKLTKVKSDLTRAPAITKFTKTLNQMRKYMHEVSLKVKKLGISVDELNFYLVNVQNKYPELCKLQFVDGKIEDQIIGY